MNKDLLQVIKLLAEKPKQSFEREKTLNSTQKTFAGKTSENVEQWVQTINLNMKAANVPELRQLVIAAGYLNDAALQFYQKEITADPKLLWKDFEKSLIKHFRPANYQDVLLNKLNELTQKSNFSKYIEQFTIMVNQTENLPDHVKKYMFIKGLNENIAANVNFRRPNSLIEAIQLAKDFEESFPTKTNEISKNSEINLIRSYKSKQRISHNVCFQCGRTGHRRAKCPQLNKANKYDKQKKKQKNAYKKTICTYCGKTSHVESECLKKQREELNKNNDRNNYKNNYKNDRNEN